MTGPSTPLLKAGEVATQSCFCCCFVVPGIELTISNSSNTEFLKEAPDCGPLGHCLCLSGLSGWLGLGKVKGRQNPAHSQITELGLTHSTWRWGNKLKTGLQKYRVNKLNHHYHFCCFPFSTFHSFFIWPFSTYFYEVSLSQISLPNYRPISVQWGN